MTETSIKPPIEPTQPDLPGFSTSVQALTPEQRTRVIECAFENGISDVEALKKIREEDSEKIPSQWKIPRNKK